MNQPTHQCRICKERLKIDTALDHLSAVHGIVYREVPNSEYSKEDNDKLTARLMSIKGTRINN